MQRRKKNSFAARFGQSIKFFRQEKGLSQEKLAELARVHRTYISTIELGKQTISIEIAYRLAQALKTPLSDIIKRTEQ